MAFFSFFRRILGSAGPYAETGGSISAGTTSNTSTLPTSTKITGGITNERYPTDLDINNPTMLEQLHEARKYRSEIEQAARRCLLPSGIICGIGSRESHWGLALTPPNPGGRGDFSKRKPRGDRRGEIPNDGPGYGRGLMQIDYDWHEFARTGNWQNPRANLLKAADVLNDARRFLQERIHLSEKDLTQAIIAAYNAGATATLNCLQDHNDVDCATTGLDYSKDVLNRSGWFQLHGWQ
jgi:hypothetical protein